MEKVILVDPQDRPQGLMEKMEAHEKGLLHRAISVFVFNAAGKVMLQQRASHKYHSPDLWTNTACSHPRDGESALEAANRRLMEEMGLASTLNPAFTFIYKAEFDNGLIEHELDHVFLGFSEEEPKLNPEEVRDWKWADPKAVSTGIVENPDLYTPWFKIIWERVVKHLQEQPLQS